jgi:LDH2 family malate/lactate/ureidoglycolate dehydrogenase
MARGELVEFVGALLRAAGMGADDAHGVATALVDADARGVDSHGVARLPVYLDRIAAGGSSATARPVVEREHGAVAVVDGRDALGLVVGRFGMETALRLAHQHGVGAVTCRRSGHFGAAAEFARMGTGCDCVTVSMTNVNVAMAPWGGITPLLGNNPMAVAAPTSGAPFVLDMALSTVARGKIRLAAARGEEIPPGWALAADGTPTVDALVALAGLITPLGGPKGSALAIAVDILSALLSGAATSPDVKPQAALADPQDVGHFFLALHVPAFVDPAVFRARIDHMLERIRNSTRAAGVAEVLAPGDLERRAEERAGREGIALQRSTWQALLAKAADLGVTAPSPS